MAIQIANVRYANAVTKKDRVDMCRCCSFSLAKADPQDDNDGDVENDNSDCPHWFRNTDSSALPFNRT